MTDPSSRSPIGGVVYLLLIPTALVTLSRLNDAVRLSDLFSSFLRVWRALTHAFWRNLIPFELSPSQMDGLSLTVLFATLAASPWLRISDLSPSDVTRMQRSAGFWIAFLICACIILAAFTTSHPDGYVGEFSLILTLTLVVIVPLMAIGSAQFYIRLRETGPIQPYFGAGLMPFLFGMMGLSAGFNFFLHFPRDPLSELGGSLGMGAMGLSFWALSIRRPDALIRLVVLVGGLVAADFLMDFMAIDTSAWRDWLRSLESIETTRLYEAPTA